MTRVISARTRAEMGYEIDFLPVGDGSRSGDAIALRYGNLHGERSEQRVVVIDGGFTDDGEALVELIRSEYGTNRVDIVVSTHPDQDHVCGLEVVLAELEVGELWMHQPWAHSADLAAERRSSFTKAALPEKVEKSLAGASDLEEIARARGVPIVEPFLGLATGDNTFSIVGPTLAYYEELLTQIKSGRDAAVLAIREAIAGVVTKVLQFAQETLHIETLTDSGTVSPQNNSSAICLLRYDGRAMLFTADAGMPALEHALDVLDAAGISGKLDWVQVPHHGSRRNVGPSVLDRVLGPTGQSTTKGTAYVSAASQGAPKHPAKKVTNAFRRRGYEVYGTLGTHIFHRSNSPRTGQPVAPIPFYDRVEEDPD